ncbi:MAG: DUF1552 domain-containing protein, partial [Bdellovibrionota bacterium]
MKTKAHSKLPIVYDPISRRMFLRTAGAALAIPYLPSLLPRAEAAEALPCIVLTGATHGRWQGSWYPNGVALPSVGTNVRATKLSNITTGLGPVFGRDFDSLRNKMNIIQGLDFMSASQHDSQVYTASHRSHFKDGDVRNFIPVFPYTADVVLAKSSRFYTSRPKLDVLRLSPRNFDRPGFEGVRGIDGLLANGQANYLPVFGDTLLRTANYLNSFFSGGTSPTGPAPDVIQRRFLVDRVLSEFKTVLGSSQISAKDKTALQNYTDHLTDVQRDLATTSAPGPALTCSPFTSPGETADNDVFNQRLIDMMVLALTCGITRIATYDLNWMACASTTGSVDFHSTVGVHACSRPSGFDNMVNWNRYQMKNWRYIVTKMDQQGILDNSLVLFANEMSSSTPNHHGNDIPVLTAGSLGGKFRTGEFISYFNMSKRLATAQGEVFKIVNADGTTSPSWNYYGGRRWNEMLVSMFKALGLNPADYERDGKTGFGAASCAVAAGADPVMCGIENGDTYLHHRMNQYYVNDYKESLNATLP